MAFSEIFNLQPHQPTSAAHMRTRQPRGLPNTPLLKSWWTLVTALKIKSLNTNQSANFSELVKIFSKFLGFCLPCQFKYKGSDFPEMQSPAFLICADLHVLQLQRLSHEYPQLGQGQASQPLHKWGQRCCRGRTQSGGRARAGQIKLRKILSELLIAIMQGLGFYLSNR